MELRTFMEKIKALLAEFRADTQARKDDWIEGLASVGIKAAHPDDDWVDNRLNKLHMMYPQFNLGVQIGDRIALGREPDFEGRIRHRIVQVADIKMEGILFLAPRYYFEPVS